jgi:hypothetical protein
MYFSVFLFSDLRVSRGFWGEKSENWGKGIRYFSCFLGVWFFEVFALNVGCFGKLKSP